MYKCKTCLIEKEVSGFYKNNCKRGHDSVCKECAKKRSTKNRNARIDHYREYDRNRGCRHSPSYLREWRGKYPNKYKAHGMVNNAIKGEKLFKEDCACGSDKDLHAHHDDYAKPLNVRWLCASCHRIWHLKNGEGLNP